MDWWQLAIVLFISVVNLVVVGLFLGILLSALLLRREAAIFDKYKPSPSSTVQLKSNTDDLLDEFLEKHKTTKRQAKKRGIGETAEGGNMEAEIIMEHANPTGLDLLLVELVKNRELSIEPRPDKLLPFQTHAWDTSGDEFHMLSTNLRWELKQAYLDMFLANDIIWLLSEFELKSPNLDDQYMKMCTQITSRLDGIIPLLKRPSD